TRRQDAHGRGLRQGSDLPHGSDPRPPVPPAAAPADPGSGDRPVLHREPPAPALAGARGLSDVERQNRRLHEDRPRSGGVRRLDPQWPTVLPPLLTTLGGGSTALVDARYVHGQDAKEPGPEQERRQVDRERPSPGPP